MDKLKTLYSENRQFLLFIALMLVFRSAVADWNSVPTGSMKPTIVEGDRILIDKLAYDVRLPFTQTPIYHIADPERGDIVIFESQAAGNRLVKRVVGVPGDTVAMVDNRLIINGSPLGYHTAQNGDLIESLTSQGHSIKTAPFASPMQNFAAVTVPEKKYLVLGDNRDNSADSRVIGLVPREEIIGKSNKVVMSLNYDNFYLPRPERFFHNI